MTSTHKESKIAPLDIAEVQFALNRLLANYQVHYQKLRNFHWNVEGPYFFELHEQFEVEYSEVRQQIDTLAERILILGTKPYSTLAQYLEVAEIKEAEGELTAYQMVGEVLRDYKLLLSLMSVLFESLQKTKDVATEDMITEFMRRIEKRHWMFSSWMKKD